MNKRLKTAAFTTPGIADLNQMAEDEASAGHLAAIVQSSDDAIISKSLGSIIKSWNKGAEKMFGFTANEAIGKHISLIIPPEYISEEKKILERIANNEIIDHYETVRNKKNGEKVYVSLTISPLKNRAGNIIGVSKIARDITYQKKSEAALISANKELVFQNEEKGERAAELMVANKELAFQNEAKVERAAELVIANKELVFQNKEKEKRAAELMVAKEEIAFQNDEKEKCEADLFVANKELEFQHKEKENRAYELNIAHKTISDYKYALDASSIVAITDHKGIITHVNDNFCNISKYSSEELIGQDHRIINSGFHEKEFIRILWKQIANGKIWKGELKNKAKDGTVYWVDTTIVPFVNEQGKPYQYIAIRADITLRKETEKELLQSLKEKEKIAAALMVANSELIFQNNEKEKRAAELIIANKELAIQNEEKAKRAVELVTANQELEQIAYIAAHDLQEPLRTVSNYMQVFEEDYAAVLDDKALRYLYSVKNASKRMSLRIKSLLDFSLLGRNKKLVHVHIQKIIDDVIADLATAIKTSNAFIEVSEMPELDVYEIEMRQLFQNLVTNAIKFHKKDSPPEIQIHAEKIEQGWKFLVRDNGIGIASKYFERVFDIFQRLHSITEYDGSGIGLANCKKIIHLHHGEIWVESLPGMGATFYFTIPNAIV